MIKYLIFISFFTVQLNDDAELELQEWLSKQKQTNQF
jgi:hypothetical protein